MHLVRRSNLPAPVWAACLLLVSTAAAHAQSEIAVHTVNNSGVSYASALNATNATFTTSFKGTNDVTITLLGGAMAPVFTSSYSASPGNNPAFLTNFVGSTAQGTGNGTAGNLTFFNTSTPVSLQYDFTSGLATGDFMVFSDIDNSEKYTIQAFTRSGNVFTAVNLNTAVTPAKYTGTDTSHNNGVPNSLWASWSVSSSDPTTGWWLGSSANMNGTVNVLTLNQAIDRIVITAGTTGSQAGVQFLSTAAPASVPEPGIIVSAASMAGMIGSGLLCGRRRRYGRSAVPSPTGIA